MTSNSGKGMPNTSGIYEKLNALKIRGGEMAPSSPIIPSGSSEAGPGRPRPGRIDVRDLRRDRPCLSLSAKSNGNTATRNPDKTMSQSNPFEFENFKPEVRINGQRYNVSQCDFESISHLGDGACGTVQLMRHKPTDVLMAVKKMRRTQDLREQRRIFTDLNIVIKEHTCPSIINSYGAYITEQDVCICMEPMDTCLDKLQKAMKERGMVGGIPEPVLGKITVGVVHGLAFLKQQYSVIHRDVKPSNILIDRRGLVKICDFGIAGNLVDSKVKTRDQGCPAYMSPERIDPPDQDNPSYDIRADVWSLGITLVELAYSKYPYSQTKVQFSLMTEIINSPAPVLKSEDGFSPDFIDFVRICLIKDVNERPKYDRLLQHPFIKQYETVDSAVVADWYTTHFLNDN